MDLLGHDLLQAASGSTCAANRRPAATSAKLPTAAWTALRKAIPLKTAEQRVKGYAVGRGAGGGVRPLNRPGHLLLERPAAGSQRSRKHAL
jgi:hypothetical protein